MKSRSLRIASILGLILLLVATGCQDYEVQTVVNKDGSGSRTVTLTLDPYKEYAESTITLKDAETLFRVREAGQWDMSWTGKPRDPESHPVYTRRRKIRGIDDWASALNEVFIKGTIQSGELEQIEMKSRIDVTAEEGPAGMSYTYRERFWWIGLKPVLTDWFIDVVCNSLQRRYDLTDGSVLTELRGLYAGVIDLTWETFIDNEELEAEGANIIATLVRNTKRIIESSGKRVGSEDLTAILTSDLKDEGDKILDRAERELPGVFGAGFTGIKLSVTLPGIIMESNADKVEGNTATWEFGALDPLKAPKELFVRSEIID